MTNDTPVALADGALTTVEKGRMFTVLERKDRQVGVLVCVGTEVRGGWIDIDHVKFLTDDDVDLGAEALRIAKAMDPRVDVDACSARLEALCGRLAYAAAHGGTERERAKLIADCLFTPEGFSYETRASRLDIALDRKRGNCIALSLLHLRAARALGMRAHLATAPEHVFVRYEGHRDPFDVETTKGRVFPADGDSRWLSSFIDTNGRGIRPRVLSDPRALGVLLSDWGNALLAGGRPGTACGKFARALELNPDDPYSYCRLAAALVLRGDHLAAIDIYAGVTRLYPRYAPAYTDWGRVLILLGRPTEACDKLRKAVELSPRSARAYAAWGEALAEMQRFDEACGKLRKAVELSPRSARAYVLWGEALLKMQRFDEACGKFRKAVELSPRSARAYVVWGAALLKMQRFDEACGKFDRAAEISPREPYPHKAWGYALYRLGRYEQACEKCSRAAALDPLDAEVQLCWGAALLKWGREAEAAKRLNKAQELDPKLRRRIESLRRAPGASGGRRR